jgi:hypothetical protein
LLLNPFLLTTVMNENDARRFDSDEKSPGKRLFFSLGESSHLPEAARTSGDATIQFDNKRGSALLSMILRSLFNSATGRPGTIG